MLFVPFMYLLSLSFSFERFVYIFCIMSVIFHIYFVDLIYSDLLFCILDGWYTYSYIVNTLYIFNFLYYDYYCFLFLVSNYISSCFFCFLSEIEWCTACVCVVFTYSLIHFLSSIYCFDFLILDSCSSLHYFSLLMNVRLDIHWKCSFIS
ncbi:hypothetical protein V1511DRAFT_121437 [Dipodascopsis uninucleata]